jgi:tRNA (Thr-GGU) A37 N-methylase
MASESFEVVPVAHVVGGRIEPTDDYWGGTRSIIRIDDSRFTADATQGLEEFSHLEIVFRFHLTNPADLHLGARRPRDNPDWPQVGIFGHRNMRRLNWLGVSRCRLLRVDGLDLHVGELDAVDGTPILDIKPWFTDFGPRGEVRQASWTTEMLGEYFALPPGGTSDSTGNVLSRGESGPAQTSHPA